MANSAVSTSLRSPTGVERRCGTTPFDVAGATFAGQRALSRRVTTPIFEVFDQRRIPARVLSTFAVSIAALLRRLVEGRFSENVQSGLAASSRSINSSPEWTR